MRIGRMVLTATLTISTIICGFSLIMYMNFSRLLDIPKQVLKSGTFDLSDKAYEFTFSVPKEARYNIVLKFFLERQNDPITEYRSGYTVDTEIRDKNDKFLTHKVVDQNSRIHESWSNEEYRRDVLSFNAEKKQIFKLIIAFQNENDLLNRLNKEIYIEKDYDPASKPWWMLFQRGFLIIFVITLISVLIIGVILWKRKGKGMGP
ncbi:MAG TPA: hypothetical protein VN328_05620 [Thermodesulfovibrionales bacterium]|nr:hypothetical protein [Thermodesulfovibrionales bacterium]